MFNVYRKLFFYVPKEKWLATLAIVITSVSTIMTMIAYYYIGEFLRRLLVFDNTDGAARYATLIVSLLFVGSLVYLVAVLLTHILGFRLETNLRKKGIDGLINSSFKFFDLNSSGRTRQLIDDNAAQTHSIVAHLIPDIAGAVLTPILVFVVAFMFDIKLGIGLIVFTIIGATQVAKMTGEKEFMARYQAALEKMNSETVEYVRGMQVIKIFGADINSFKVLKETILTYSDDALSYSMSCRAPYLFFQIMFLGAMGIAVPLVVLFTDYLSDPKVLAVNLIMLLFLLGVLFTGFMKIMYLSMYAFQGTSAVEKLESIFDEMQRDRLKFGSVDKFDNFDIEFNNVCFGYNDEYVLEDISFKLEGNKCYALVGSSGSGKSTIAKLISGFYNIQSGEIRIGGKKLTDYTEEAITKNIAFVFQDSKLFKMSIYENVKLANPDATREEVMQALSQAGCDALIQKFPNKENTEIGAKGVFLSGGEKQRIAIARAILKNANIIIMDEASAAVDPENEHELQKAFKNLIKGKTVIMIAHRLSSIRAVDEVIVLEDGKIIERGTDEELMNKDSRYKYYQDLYAMANEWRVGNEKLV